MIWICPNFEMAKYLYSMFFFKVSMTPPSSRRSAMKARYLTALRSH